MWENELYQDGEMAMEIDKVFNYILDESDSSRSGSTSHELLSPDEISVDPFSLHYNGQNDFSSSEFFPLNEFPQMGMDEIDPTALAFMEELAKGSHEAWSFSNVSQPKGVGSMNGINTEPMALRNEQSINSDTQNQSRSDADSRMTIVIDQARTETLFEVMKVLMDSQARVEFHCG
jgi:hypothetical protein